MSAKSYWLSIPERLVRSTLGLGAGVAREVTEVALPDAMRQSQVYRNLVDATLRFLIEQVGEVKGVYNAEGALPDNFLTRRTAGNAIEVMGVVAFSASPVWILAALADVSGMGRSLIPEISEALKTQGLLDKDSEFATVDQMLDGFERTSARLAKSFNTPPLDVAGLRKEWAELREAAASLPGGLPSRETIASTWASLKAESVQQKRSVFETSSLMAVSAVRALPGRVRWLTASARVGATRTGQIVGGALLEHYKETLAEIQQIGYLAYANRQLGPYVRAAVGQFAPGRQTMTERGLQKYRAWRQRRRSRQRPKA